MQIVHLKHIGEGPFIEASPNCPHSTVDPSTEKSIINAIICGICKSCKFITTEMDVSGLTEEESSKILHYLTEVDKDIADSISGQILYLKRKSRLALAMLLSPNAFLRALSSAIPDSARRQSVFSYVLTYETPVCYIAGCPVYLSRKLTESQIQVIGEVSWR